jgi:hypothetical protein
MVSIEAVFVSNNPETINAFFPGFVAFCYKARIVHAGGDNHGKISAPYSSSGRPIVLVFIHLTSYAFSQAAVTRYRRIKTSAVFHGY